MDLEEGERERRSEDDATNATWDIFESIFSLEHTVCNKIL